MNSDNVYNRQQPFQIQFKIDSFHITSRTIMEEIEVEKEKKIVRQMFTMDEDDKLCALVKEFGEKNWRTISKHMPNRTTRQCRERYRNYLSPTVKNGPWTPEEDLLLEQKYLEYGPKWATIAQFFRSRSDVNIKNRWASNRHKCVRTTPKSLWETLRVNPKDFWLRFCRMQAQVKQQENPIKQEINFTGIEPSSLTTGFDVEEIDLVLPPTLDATALDISWDNSFEPL